MRPEIKEYDFDWMLAATMRVGALSDRGPEKEFRRLLKYIPYFANILDSIISEGPAGMAFFSGISSYLRAIRGARERGDKVAITTFCFSPAILYAMGVQPITLEILSTLAHMTWKRGTFDYLDFACEAGFTETSCSSQRGSLGAYLAGLGVDIDFVVCDSAGVCDTNANAFAFASAYLDRPMYQLNYPQTLDDEATRKYQVEDYKQLIKFIEQQTGRGLSEDRLRSILDEIKKQDLLLQEIEDLQRAAPNPMPPIYNLFLYGGRFIFAGTEDYTVMLTAMLDTLRANVAAGRSGLKCGSEKVRALFVYIDHYTHHLGFYRWLNDRGVTHVGNILSRFYPSNAPYITGNQAAYEIDTSSMDSMISSIAKMNAMMPMVRTIRGPYDAPDMWLDATLSLAKIYSADCVIYNGTPGCRNTWGMVKPFMREMEKAGYPAHIMYGDAFDDRVESWETTRSRLDEFLEIRRLL